MEGSDETAFVGKQLGIDSVSRLELMIAAMTGRTKLVFEGSVVNSGLNIQEWQAGHAIMLMHDSISSALTDK